MKQFGRILATITDQAWTNVKFGLKWVPRYSIVHVVTTVMPIEKPVQQPNGSHLPYAEY